MSGPADELLDDVLRAVVKSLSDTEKASQDMIDIDTRTKFALEAAVPDEAKESQEAFEFEKKLVKESLESSTEKLMDAADARLKETVFKVQILFKTKDTPVPHSDVKGKFALIDNDGNASPQTFVQALEKSMLLPWKGYSKMQLDLALENAVIVSHTLHGDTKVYDDKGQPRVVIPIEPDHIMTVPLHKEHESNTHIIEITIHFTSTTGGDAPSNEEEKKAEEAIKIAAEKAKLTQSAGWVDTSKKEELKNEHEGLSHILQWLENPAFADIKNADPAKTSIERIKLRLAALGDASDAKTIEARKALLPVTWGEFMTGVQSVIHAISKRREELAKGAPKTGAA